MERLLGRAENVLDALFSKLEEETEKFVEYADRAAKARAAYKMAWATVFLKTEGAMDLRRVTADSQTFPQLREKEVAEGLEKSQRQVLESLRTQMDACRTVMASARI